MFVRWAIYLGCIPVLHRLVGLWVTNSYAGIAMTIPVLLKKTHIFFKGEVVELVCIPQASTTTQTACYVDSASRPATRTTLVLRDDPIPDGLHGHGLKMF